jgi:hypothetical protein
MMQPDHLLQTKQTGLPVMVYRQKLRMTRSLMMGAGNDDPASEHNYIVGAVDECLCK